MVPLAGQYYSKYASIAEFVAKLRVPGDAGRGAALAGLRP